MGLISTGIAGQSSIVAQSSQGNTGVRADTAGVQSSVNQSSATAQTAAVVHLSSDSKNRAASRGEGRSVDASFEKQEAQEKEVEKKEDQTPEKAKINISA